MSAFCWSLVLALSIVDFDVSPFVIIDQHRKVGENVDLEGSSTILQVTEKLEPAEESGNLNGVIEGDIIADESKAEKRKFARLDLYLWPGGVIPWKYNTGERKFRNPVTKRYVEMALRHLEIYTCVNFVNMVTESREYNRLRQIYRHGNYIDIGSGQGCAAMVGYQEQQGQPIMLHETFCLQPGTMVHELGHSLGLFHEQNRADRDTSIKINWEYVQPEALINFKTFESIENLAPYDVQSIMHYGPKAFSKNGNDTIEAKDKLLDFLLGQRSGLSFYDAVAINKAYKCSDKCENEISCQNDGFMVKQCRCLCPKGLAGESCESIDPYFSEGCGFVYTLSDGETRTVETSGYPGPYTEKTCVWLIKAPPGQQITLTLTVDEVPRNEESHQCFHWIEIRYNLIGQDGPWICGKDAKREFTSTKNQILILFDATDDQYTGTGFRAVASIHGHSTEEVSDVPLNCNFDDDVCGFHHETDSPYIGWTRTSRLLTGPFSDHTSGNGKFLGRFVLYAKPDLISSLISPTVNLADVRCIRFWFFAYGVSFGSLTLYIQQEQQIDPVWVLQLKYLYSPWEQIEVPVENIGRCNIIFEYVSGNLWGSFAIDDLRTDHKPCAT